MNPQRQSNRIPGRWPAVVHAHGRTARATCLDLSRGGARIERHAGRTVEQMIGQLVAIRVLRSHKVLVLLAFSASQTTWRSLRAPMSTVARAERSWRRPSMS